MKDDLRFEDYCQKCKNYDLLGVCRKIHLNVKDYPNKFKEKCSGEFFEIDENKETILKEIDNEFEIKKETGFNILNGYSAFVCAIGWIIIIIGLISSIYTGIELEYPVIVIIIGFVLFFIAGINMVVFGHLIKCFVSIESNTRQTNKLLEK